MRRGACGGRPHPDRAPRVCHRPADPNGAGETTTVECCEGAAAVSRDRGRLAAPFRPRGRSATLINVADSTGHITRGIFHIQRGRALVLPL